MKRILAVMVLMGFLGLSVLFYSRTYSRVADAVMAAGEAVKKTVVIDPGHGGNDPGGG